MQGNPGSSGLSGFQVVLGGEIVQSTDNSGTFDVSCPAGKHVLGGGVATYNTNIQVESSTPLDDGTDWEVTVVPKTGSAFGGSGAQAVNIRITCAFTG
jgi:hypothetical protein